MVLGGVGAAIAQSEVVFAGAALVGVAFDRDANLRILGEPCGLGVQRGGRGAVQLIAVEGEEDAVGASLFHEVGHGTRRSEEHTSELQSLMRISYAVFCLKKKNKIDDTKDT